jgi:hypothetical protein
MTLNNRLLGVLDWLGNGNGAAEIGAQITKLTDAMPSPEDIALVEARLVSHHGWPLDDE